MSRLGSGERDKRRRERRGKQGGSGRRCERGLTDVPFCVLLRSSFRPDLITPRAHGVVLDLGAGHGESVIEVEIPKMRRCDAVLRRQLTLLLSPTPLSSPGHSIQYLDVKKVTKYIALEPNALMHEKLRCVSVAANLV